MPYKNKDINKKYHHDWDMAHKHPCIDCGEPCSYSMKRCYKCGMKHRINPRQRPAACFICSVCGKSISGKGISNKCRSCTMKESWRSGKLKSFPSGKAHPNWKGGRIAPPGGYVLIRLPGHPNAKNNGYVFEHRLVWETANGKPLPDGWIIHHLNGIKADNRIRNLIALPNKKHYLVLQAKAKRIQELEALLNGQSQLI